MAISEIFRQNLRYYRKLRNLTQEALSEKIGLNPNYITNIESQSKFPSAETIDAIAEALDIDVEKLFATQGCPKNAVNFDKDGFIENLVHGISYELKFEVTRYLDKNL